MMAMTTTISLLSKGGVSLVREDAVRSTVSTPGIKKVIELAEFVLGKAFLVRTTKTVLLLPIFMSSCNLGKV